METNGWSDQVVVAAKWWSDQLRRDDKPSRQTERPGRPDLLGAMLSAYSAKVPDVDEAQIAAFENALLPLIAKWIEDEPYRGFGCDYQPCDLLLDAADAAGIDGLSNYLPIKTMLWFEDGKVKVKVGYGSPSVTIYPAR